MPACNHPSNAQGYFHDGQVFLVADNITPETAPRILAHEAVGHLGVRQLLGKPAFNSTLKQITKDLESDPKLKALHDRIKENYTKEFPNMLQQELDNMLADELIAHVAETTNLNPPFFQRVMNAVRAFLRNKGFPVKWTDSDIRGLIVSSAKNLERQGKLLTPLANADTASRYSLADDRPAAARQAENMSEQEIEQQINESINNFSGQRRLKTLKEQVQDFLDALGLKIVTQIFDRYAPLQHFDDMLQDQKLAELENKAENAPTEAEREQAKQELKNLQEMGLRPSERSYIMTRMANSATQAMQNLVEKGLPKLRGNSLIIEPETRGIAAILSDLGDGTEINRFLSWRAANSIDALGDKFEGKEEYIKALDVETLKRANIGQTENGGDRAELYQRINDELAKVDNAIATIAEDSGIMTPQDRDLFQNGFYMPLFRMVDDEKNTGVRTVQSIANQGKLKLPKGENLKVNDLMQNMLMNYQHLLDASMKNRAAQQATENLSLVGVMEKADGPVPGSIHTLENGKRVYWKLTDDVGQTAEGKLAMQAVLQLSDTGIGNSLPLRVARSAKQIMTQFTTMNPAFIVANTFRDVVQAPAITKLNMRGFTSGVATAIRAVGKDGDAFFDDMVSSGGVMSFAKDTTDPLEMHKYINSKRALFGGGSGSFAVRLFQATAGTAWSKYEDIQRITESMNRVGLAKETYKEYKDKLMAQGLSESDADAEAWLQAAYEAKDYMDFGLSGKSATIRLLTQTVPFFGARLQGMYKLGRSGFNIINLTPAKLKHPNPKIRRKAQAAARFYIVTAAVTTAGLMLLAGNHDEEWWKAIPEKDKMAYWHFKLPGVDKVFRLPRPFEVGAIGMMGESIAEAMFTDNLNGKDVARRFWQTMHDTFQMGAPPQVIAPMMQLMNNKNSFGSAIETDNMQYLNPEQRYTARTTEVAKWLSKPFVAFGEGVSAVSGMDTSGFQLSPVQIDHLINGYFSWLGGFVTKSVSDTYKHAAGITDPEKTVEDMPLLYRFVRNDPDAKRSTAYSQAFYDTFRAAESVHSKVKAYREMGDIAQSQKEAQKGKDKLAMLGDLRKAQRLLSELSKRERYILNDRKMDAALKRAELDNLYRIRNQIQKRFYRK